MYRTCVRDVPNAIHWCVITSATEVEIGFSSRDGKTEVVLTHSGWEAYGEKADEIRGGYDKGWDTVLGTYIG